jgi:hypothetical protein
MHNDNFNNALIGSTVEKVSYVEDYFQVYFSNGFILNINNDFSYNKPIEKLPGEIVIKTIEDNLNYIISFSNDYMIIVNLEDKAWHCPEAMELTNGEIFIIYN